MRIFGLDIQRTSKLDQKECNTFINTTIELFDEMNRYYEDLENFNLDQFGSKESGMLFGHLETIKSLFNVYENNKFSSPGQCFSLGYHLMELSKRTVNFNKQLQSFNQLKFNTLGAMEDGSIEELGNDAQVRLTDAITSLWNQLPNGIRYIETHLEILIMIIRYDVMRILMGVDIIRDYHDTNQRIKLNGGDQFEYKISFIHKRKEGGNKS